MALCKLTSEETTVLEPVESPFGSATGTFAVPPLEDMLDNAMGWKSGASCPKGRLYEQ